MPPLPANDPPSARPLSRQEMLYLEANALHRLGRLKQAQSLYHQVLATQPSHFESLYQAGLVAHQLGEPASAVKLISQALAVNGDVGEARANLGMALLDLKRPDEALAEFDRASELDPGLAATHAGRGDALRALQRLPEAQASYERALALNPKHLAALISHGVVLRDLGQPELGLHALDAAIAVAPESRVAHFYRGVALRRLERFEEAIVSYDRAIAIDPRLVDAHVNRANALQELLRLDEAIAGYERAVALEPDNAEAHCNMACALLMTGDFERGWKTYEWRWKSTLIQEPPPSFAQPAWRGVESLQGKTILLYSEQGLGDAIQFCRYASLVADLGARVMLRVPDHLIPLLQSVKGLHVLAAKGAQLPPFDYECPLLSLPLVFKTRADNVPAQVPYLRPRAPLVQQWAQFVTRATFNVGICWHASQAGVGRSIPLSSFADIARIEGLQLFSLQKGDCTEQLAQLPQGMQVRAFGDDFDSQGAFLDSAALIWNLDLVITADTAMAHLAGALGKPVWVLVKQLPDWRWGLTGNRTPWYPTMWLFRQRSRGDWRPCFEEMAAELRAILALRFQ